MAQYEMKRTLAELSRTKTTEKLLTITSWNGNAPRLDLRNWYRGEAGDLQPGKGITLSDDEAAEAAAVICGYLKEGGEHGEADTN